MFFRFVQLAGLRADMGQGAGQPARVDRGVTAFAVELEGADEVTLFRDRRLALANLGGLFRLGRGGDEAAAGVASLAGIHLEAAIGCVSLFAASYFEVAHAGLGAFADVLRSREDREPGVAGEEKELEAVGPVAVELRR